MFTTRFLDIPPLRAVSGTVRVAFPFERDTAAAVFRRGNALWMLFDTATPINQPEQSEALSSIASAFTVTGAGETQVVRIDLNDEVLVGARPGVIPASAIW
jgi:hypothetical protein